jgi:hypothetical protein
VSRVGGYWPGWWWTSTVLVVLVVAGWYLSFTAGRLDRLHARVEGAFSALDAQLVRRGAVALEVATSGLLDPATSVLLAAAALEARDTDTPARWQAESDLSKALRVTVEAPETLEHLGADPHGRDLVDELGAAAQRVQLARRFHNDAVRATLALRRTLVVRWFRLAGHAPLPQTVELDDEAPAGLTR